MADIEWRIAAISEAVARVLWQGPVRPTAEAFPGFQEMKPMVFAGLYPNGETSYENLRDALERLRLNDSSFSVEAETSEPGRRAIPCQR